jgi:hypothetical protein
MSRRWRKRIDAVLDGELPADEVAALRAEIEADPEGRALLAADERISQALASLEPEPPGRDIAAAVTAAVRRPLADLPAEPPRRLGLRLALAAGGLVVGGLIGVLITLTLTEQPAPSRAPDGPAVAVAPDPAPPRCRVRKVHGEVLRQAGDQFVPLSRGEHLVASDVIRTGHLSRAELDIDPDARLVLHHDSRLSLVRLEDRLRTFELIHGRATVDLLDGGKRAVRIQAAGLSAMAEGRRGSFAALVADKGRAAFGAVEGSLKVTHRGDSRRLDAGQQALLTAEAPEPTIGPVPEQVALKLTKPSGALRPGRRVAVAGRSSSHARVWLNDRPLELDADGRFATHLPVERGERLIAYAEDLVGNTRRIEIGPASLSQPQAQSPPQPRRRIDVRNYRVNW